MELLILILCVLALFEFADHLVKKSNRIEAERIRAANNSNLSYEEAPTSTVLLPRGKSNTHYDITRSDY